MGKGRYHSLAIKKSSAAQILERVGVQNLIVGIDVAKVDFFASIMTRDDRKVHQTVKWKHPAESALFVDLVCALADGGRDVVAVMEPSGVYGDAVRHALWNANIEVYRVSPKRSHDAAEVYDGVASLHDAKSAAIISKLHVDGASELWPVEEDGEREIKARVRLIEIYQKEFQRNRNRLEGLLSRHWPELTEQLDLGSATLLELISKYGGPQAVSTQGTEARDLMTRVGSHFLSPDKVDAVIASASRSYGIPQLEAERELVMTIACEARRQQKLMNQARKVVVKLVESHSASRAMAPVIGKTTAAIVVAAAGDPLRYGSATAWEKALGLNLKEKSSGKHKGPLHITKRGSGVARMHLYLAVLRLLQKDPIVRAWYDKKVKRMGGLAKSKAVVAVMRKLSRALWHVARGDEFNATLLFDVSRLKLPAGAMVST